MDETQSQDIAFSSEDKPTFTFEDESSNSDSQSKEDTTVKQDSSSSENDVVEEQRVPYSRFSKVNSRVHELEEQLAQMQVQRQEIALSTEEPDQEWKTLYGDSQAARDAFKVQRQREMMLEEKAAIRAIDIIRKQEGELEQRVDENVQLIEDNLANLQKEKGIKITPRMEQDILTIVDEFSPTDDKGNYVTLFPFDKAFEIYSLRNGNRVRAQSESRNAVAAIQSDSSNIDDDSSGHSFQRGWDNWRTEL